MFKVMLKNYASFCIINWGTISEAARFSTYYWLLASQDGK